MALRLNVSGFLVALLLVSANGAAQVSAADRATARSLAQQGQEALEAKDWSTAAERFARADALIHAPTLMLGLARAEVGGGRWVLALEHYNRIAREGVPKGSPPSWGKALADAERELAAFEPRVPAVIVRVSGASNARVTIDGVAVPAAALGVNRPVDPGKRTIRAEADGYVPAEATVTCREGKVETVALQLEPSPAAPSASEGHTPSSPPVHGDGAAPPPTAPLAQAATPNAGATSTPPANGPPLRTLGFVGLGVGGAGLAVGALAGGLAVAKHAELAKVCPNGRCSGQASNVSAYNLLGALSTAGIVAGGVLAATGVVLLAVAPRDPPPPGEAWIAPVIGAGYAGVRGRF